MTGRDDVIFCSFYTDDDYYRAYADKLRENFEALGFPYELLEIHKGPDDDWADLTRRKIGFIADVCAKNPDKKVFWTDVDCSILDMPDYVINFSADIVGFTRGFGTAMGIGYGQRQRFWEPCFWGINTSPQARKLIADADASEKANPQIKATDDYFMEEAWRINANDLSFQIIPSNAVFTKGVLSDNSHGIFYKFGSSGNVADFKDKVVQHGGRKKLTPRNIAKKIESSLPDSISTRLRAISDATGLTGLLVGNKIPGVDKGTGAEINHILRLTKRAGTQRQVEAKIAEFSASREVTQVEKDAISAIETFSFYGNRNHTKTGEHDAIRLAWWTRPFPGNYGDWLSPLVYAGYTDRNIVAQTVSGVATHKHIFSLGSIGRFIKHNSVVVGTGISSEDVELNPHADYISVRGPITAKVVAASGGPKVESFGDPGVLLSRLIPIERATTNGRIALVRHFTHRGIPLNLRDDMDELDVLMSHPHAIHEFIVKLAKYDRVVTSAMHVFITCQSYGIPCALVTFEGFADAVHGSGIKYGDYARGAGLTHIDPSVVALDLTSFDLDNVTTHEKVSNEKLDEVEQAVRTSLSRFAKH